MLAQTQGHKNTHDRKRIDSFWNWVSKAAPKRGRIDFPTNFDDEACRKQACEVEAEDILEDVVARTEGTKQSPAIL